MYRRLMFAMMSILTFNQSHAEISGSHGGDPCEQRFKDISSNFLQWVKTSAPNNLHLPDNVYPQEFRDKISGSISNYLTGDSQSHFSFSCVKEEVVVNGIEKTCAWTSPADDPKITDGKTHIVCNFDRFSKGDTASPLNLEAFQFRQTIHEWTSINGFEKNQGSVSEYQITDQITSNGEWSHVYRLNVNTDTRVNVQLGMSYSSKIPNPDGSVALEGIKIEYQNRNYPISYESPVSGSAYLATCHAFGFETALEDVSGFTQMSTLPEDAMMLDESGAIVGVGFHQLTISRVTCLNQSELKTVLNFNVQPLTGNGTYLVKDLRLNRGDELLRVVVPRAGYAAICCKAGFKDLVGAHLVQRKPSLEMSYSAHIDASLTFKEVKQMDSSPSVSVECR